MNNERMALSDDTLLRQAAFIGGRWIEASPSRPSIPVHDPSTGSLLGAVPSCGVEETRAAIDAANEVAPAWRRMPAGERARLLEAWYDLILENEDDLARIMTCEQGKPLAEAGGEIRYAATFIKWFAEEGRRVSGHDIPAPTADRRVLAMKEPIGVTAAITPWNFPAAMITRKAGAALAAGCPMIIKPSELTPFTALALAALAERAGLPAGVLSVVTGPPQGIGGELTSSPVVRKLSFTGSTAVGALLMRQCADTIKRVSLELGGNAPFIVFDDADVEAAVAGVMASKFRNAGQTCVCANRIFVQSGIHDRFVERLTDAVSTLVVGDGLTPGTTIGPLINPAAVQKVSSHLEDALARGGVLTGRAAAHGDPDRFFAPAVISGADLGMRLAQEETFGPLAPIFRFDSEAEALQAANGTPFGLAAYFYTDDLHRAWRVADALEFGIVGLNTGLAAMEMAPFGGMKASGLGREGGREGIEEYLETKAFHWGGLKLENA